MVWVVAKVHLRVSLPGGVAKNFHREFGARGGVILDEGACTHGLEPAVLGYGGLEEFVNLNEVRWVRVSVRMFAAEARTIDADNGKQQQQKDLNRIKR